MPKLRSGVPVTPPEDKFTMPFMASVDKELQKTVDTLGLTSSSPDSNEYPHPSSNGSSVAHGPDSSFVEPGEDDGGVGPSGNDDGIIALPMLGMEGTSPLQATALPFGTDKEFGPNSPGMDYAAGSFSFNERVMCFLRGNLACSGTGAQVEVYILVKAATIVANDKSTTNAAKFWLMNKKYITLLKDFCHRLW